MKGRRMFTAIMAVCDATAAASAQRRVWMQSRSREWWGRVVKWLQRNSFHQKVQDDKGYIANVHLEWCRSRNEFSSHVCSS